MDLYSEMALKIIKGQEAIIGPVAIEQAERVAGLKVDWEHHQVAVGGEQSHTISDLIEVYQQLFGQISVEVSRDAVANLLSQLSPEKIPEALK